MSGPAAADHLRIPLPQRAMLTPSYISVIVRCV